jgi:hypothetical protein
VPRTALTIAIALLVACTARPVPLSAQAGSTIVFPIADGSRFIQVGYTSEIGRSFGRFDDQFGETVFALVAADGTEHELRTRWVTRTWPDPASPAGIAGRLPQPAPQLRGQVLALIDIPLGVPPGPYRWRVYRRHRPELQPHVRPGDFLAGEGELFRNFANAPDLGEFVVLPGTGTPTPNEPFFGELDGSQLGGTEAHMEQLIPYPKAVFAFSRREAVQPAAADIRLAYPRDKVEIMTVFEDASLGRGSLVRWVDDAGSGELRILFVDPDRSVARLAVAFRLRDAIATGPLHGGDFAGWGGSGFEVLAERYYDGDGLPLGGLHLAPLSVW